MVFKAHTEIYLNFYSKMNMQAFVKCLINQNIFPGLHSSRYVTIEYSIQIGESCILAKICRNVILRISSIMLWLNPSLIIFPPQLNLLYMSFSQGVYDLTVDTKHLKSRAL